ncbi:MAG TPA: hypothetical protein VIH02_03720 [Flavobacterium sp.]
MVLNIFLSLLIPILLLIIWWNLPVSINRYSDINFGNEIIYKIEAYKKANGLPENNDWKTLKKFDFRENMVGFEPEYSKLDNETFEIIFLEGFDGPYLMWNSKERKWKKGEPTLIESNKYK